MFIKQLNGVLFIWDFLTILILILGDVVGQMGKNGAAHERLSLIENIVIDTQKDPVQESLWKVKLAITSLEPPIPPQRVRLCLLPHQLPWWFQLAIHLTILVSQETDCNKAHPIPPHPLTLKGKYSSCNYFFCCILLFACRLTFTL